MQGAVRGSEQPIRSAETCSESKQPTQGSKRAPHLPSRIPTAAAIANTTYSKVYTRRSVKMIYCKLLSMLFHSQKHLTSFLNNNHGIKTTFWILSMFPSNRTTEKIHINFKWAKQKTCCRRISVTLTGITIFSPNKM